MAHKNKENWSPYKARNQGGPRTHQGLHRKPDTIYTVQEANDRLYDLFKNHNADWITHTERQQLAQFYVLLMENQKHDNFTRLLTLKDIGIKHFLDSLLVTRVTKLTFPLLDLGTGPGLPGIPLKLHFPNEKILLAEGVQKRVEFLKQVREKMALKNLDVIGRNINPGFCYPVNGVITRAVEDINNTLANVQGCLELGGKVFFMKGPQVDPEIDAFKASKNEFYKLTEDISYEIPETPQKRRLVVFEKIKHAGLPETDPEEHLLLEELSADEKRRWL